MGASVSVHQAIMLPPVIEKDQFEILTRKAFSRHAYDHFADHNGKVSRERLVELASMTDCYLSHEWGIDHEGRYTNTRVRKINEFLTTKGLYTNFDEGRIHGLQTPDMIRSHIQRAQCVILCMTERYFYQLKLDSDNPSKVEFYEAMNNKDLRCIIPLVMEQAAFRIPDIISTVYPLFMHKTHLDFSKYADIGNDDAACQHDLYLYVTRCIHPLREGGPFRQRRNAFLSTITGRHYTWLLRHVPKFGHDLSMKYAELIATADIESATRLWHLLQHDVSFLQRIKIPEKDALAIRNALKSDLMANFDTLNAKRMDAQLEAQNIALAAEAEAIRLKTQTAVDEKIKFTELKLMSVEDGLSRGLREWGRMSVAEAQYQRARAELLHTVDQQHEHYKHTLQSMREAQRQRNVDNDVSWRRDGFLQIGRVTEPIVASGMLYKLFIKIDRATAHLHQDEVRLDDSAQVANVPEEYQNDYHFKRHRVQQYVDRATIIQSSALVLADETLAPPETWENKDMTPEERNSRLIYLLQEAAYICRAIVNVAHYNTHHVWEFAESGVVKLLMALLAQTYLFNCPFESLFMPMSFHYLTMPTEALLAVRYLVKCGIGRRNTNARLGFLFGEAGAVDMCVEIVRFHLNDMNIASVAVEVLYVLVDLAGSAGEINLAQLMGDPNNFILLMLVLEKYQEHLGAVALALHASLMGITAIAAASGRYEDLLRGYRGHLIVPVLNTVLPLVDEHSDPELCTRLCACLSNLFLRREYQNSHYFTSDFVPKSQSFARELNKRVNFRVALRFTKKLLTSFFENDVVVLAAVIAIGDMAFNNEKIKTEFFRMKLHENLLRVLKHRMKRLDNAHPKWESVTDSIELGVDPVDTREVLYEALITAANVIITPPFLTYDTRTPETGATLQDQVEKARLKDPSGSVTAAAVGDVKLPAAVASEPPSSFNYFVQHGLAEMIMNLVTKYQDDRTLMRAVLILTNKFVYRGRYLSSLRLVTLRFCEHMMVLTRKYVDDEEMHLLCVLVLTGLLSTHPQLVGASKRLIGSDLCELMAVCMREKCRVVQCSSSRAWTHFAYPYTCRVCVVHCAAIYCSLVNDSACTPDALYRLKSVDFHGMLQCPPPFEAENLTLDAAVVVPSSSILAVVKKDAGNTDSSAPPSSSSLVVGSRTPTAVMGKSSMYDPSEMSVVPVVATEADRRLRMMTAGVFHNATTTTPKSPANRKSISAATLEVEDYAGAVRNVDYVAFMSRKEKDHIMSTLFSMFNIY